MLVSMAREAADDGNSDVGGKERLQASWKD